MFEVRRKLGVKTLETKITKRVLQRISHVLRMVNGRLTKSVVLGWPKSPRNHNKRRRRQTTLEYWRKVLKNACVDPDLVESKATDRKKWRRVIKDRIDYLEQWEDTMALRETCERDQRDRIKSDSVCEECGKVCKSVGGLKKTT